MCDTTPIALCVCVVVFAGNTCFLNSVLEVLRYTPCFLEGLEELYRHIVYLEKVKTNDAVLDSEEVRMFGITVLMIFVRIMMMTPVLGE